MSISNEAPIQSVTISGSVISTFTGVVQRGSKAESALKKIKKQNEKGKIIKEASHMAAILMKEYKNPAYTPNINYLSSCLVYGNEVGVMSWMLSIAKSIDNPKPYSSHDIYYFSEHLLFILEEIVNGHA